jgi:hypothetical protein
VRTTFIRIRSRPPWSLPAFSRTGASAQSGRSAEPAEQRIKIREGSTPWNPGDLPRTRRPHTPPSARRWPRRTRGLEKPRESRESNVAESRSKVAPASRRETQISLRVPYALRAGVCAEKLLLVTIQLANRTERISNNTPSSMRSVILAIVSPRKSNVRPGDGIRYSSTHCQISTSACSISRRGRQLNCMITIPPSPCFSSIV